jgi:hypothetical protein
MTAETNSGQVPILETAWRRFAELDANASDLDRRHIGLRKYVITLGVIATFLAIFVDSYADSFIDPVAEVLRVLLIAVPLIGSAIAAFTNRELGDGRWLAMRAGSEQILKEIYLYRTILRSYPRRRQYLSHQLATTHRQVFKSSGDKLDTHPFTGPVPPYYDPNNPDSDPGYNDLTPEDYLRYRLMDQLGWHERRLVKLRRDKIRLTAAIIASGALGALLAGIGGSFTIWVALAAAFTSALTGWEELRNRNATIANYSKVKLELTIIRDHWLSLDPEEQTETEFFQMVKATEDLLWLQNAEFIRSMREALVSTKDKENQDMEIFLADAVSSAKETESGIFNEALRALDESQERLIATASEAADTITGMVDSVSGEIEATNKMLEASAQKATEEAAALRATAEEAVDTAVAQSEQLQETITAQTEAWTETADAIEETAVAQSEQLQETITAQSEAWAETTDAAVDTAVAQSEQLQETITTQTEAWAETADAIEETAVAQSEQMQEAVATQTEAWAETADDAVDTAVAQSEAWQETADAAVDTAVAQSEAWQETADDAVDTAVAQSEAWQETADDAMDTAVAQSEAWQETADDAMDTAVAQSEAWQETADDAMETAVAQSEAWQETAEQTADTTALQSDMMRTMLEESVDDTADALAQAAVNTQTDIAEKTNDVLDEWAEWRNLDTATEIILHHTADELRNALNELEEDA